MSNIEAKHMLRFTIGIEHVVVRYKPRTMNETLSVAIAHSSDQAWLERCRDHNRKLDNKEVVQAVERRLRDLNLHNALKIKLEAHSVEERVLESVRVHREFLKHKHGRNQAAGYTEREIRQYGPREALIRTIRRGKKTEGLKTLAEHNRLDCAYEQIAIDHAHDLPEDVVECARQTLAEFKSIPSS
ncbi:MAG: hypothetical protein EXQ83_07070 [Xanthobacteraceae bacterium]|nr:hypothetical protein [Xanthobacteraceae bacterium]